MEFEKDLMKEKRETLTQMLVALMDQKDARQSELKDRLNELEKHKTEETENYWLIQYQKLLDSKPKVMSLYFFFSSSAACLCTPRPRHHRSSAYLCLTF